MMEYDLFVPLVTEDGKRVSASWLRALKKELCHHFGGVTYFPQRNEGLWRIGKITFRDKIVILRALSDRPSADAAFWKRIKRRIRNDLKQRQVLIVRRTVGLV
jgi:hypothetical protein